MTLEEYHAAVVAEIIRITKDGRNAALAGSEEDTVECMNDGLTPEDAALEILHDSSFGE